MTFTVNSSGAAQTPLATLWSNYINQVAENNPGYTILPAGLIEDLTSSAVYSIAQIDSACCEMINSLTPYSANPYTIIQLGNIAGISPKLATNTTVYVTFSAMTPGLTIPSGTIVSDGTNNYTVQDGGVIKSNLQSDPLYCVAINSGSWPIAIGSVTQVISSFPSQYGVTCANAQAGTPATIAETQSQYNSRVMLAGQVSGQGTQAFLKTLLNNVTNSQSNLTSIKQLTDGWEILVGGGDPYSYALAIYQSGIDISSLQGSVNAIQGVSNASNAVITTSLFHHFANGQNNVYISGVTGMTGVNGGPYTVQVINNNQFSINLNTNGMPVYTGGGIVTPNNRNITVNLYDAPDTYSITFVNSPIDNVNLQVTWNTDSPNYVDPSSISSLVIQPLTQYVNNLGSGQPINGITMKSLFLSAVSPLFSGNIDLISKITFSVAINGFSIPQLAGTELFYGDPESAFSLQTISITQG